MTASLLRPGLLDGISVLVAGPHVPGPVGEAVAEAAAGLGARVGGLRVDPFGDEPELAEDGADQLVWDGAGAFVAAAGGPSAEAVRAALDGAWLAVRSVARRCWIEAERPGRVVLVAPPPGDAHAAAARAGLENLARTLSIEWARYGIRAVTVHPGPATPPATVAELCAFLASPAGDYHSGSVIALDGA